MNRNKVLFWIASLSSTFAMGLHLYLIWEYFRVKYALGGGQNALCQLSATFDCAAVAASPFAAIAGIPLANFGFWTHLVFLIYILKMAFEVLYQKEKVSASTRWPLLALSLIILSAVITMTTISAVWLSTWCTFCIASYAASIAAVTSAFLWLKSEANPRSPLFGNLTIKPLLGLISIPLLTTLSHAIIVDQLGGKQLPIVIQESVMAWQQSPTQSFDIGLGITTGAPAHQAPWVLVEFVDLFCPHCKFASFPLKAYTKARNDIALVVKLFPLDNQCNPALSEKETPSDPTALAQSLRCQWALAALCAHQQQKGTDALQYIFDRQSELAQKSAELKPELQTMAHSLNLNIESYTQCLTEPETLQQLKKMGQEGKVAEIRGTPAIFLNNRELPRGFLLPVLEKAVATPNP